jgi:hypothetical protein
VQQARAHLLRSALGKTCDTPWLGLLHPPLAAGDPATAKLLVGEWAGSRTAADGRSAFNVTYTVDGVTGAKVTGTYDGDKLEGTLEGRTLRLVQKRPGELSYLLVLRRSGLDQLDGDLRLADTPDIVAGLVFLWKKLPRP